MAAFFGANEIWKTYEGDGREPVILVGVRELDAKEPVSEEEFRHSLSELWIPLRSRSPISIPVCM